MFAKGSESCAWSGWRCAKCLLTLMVNYLDCWQPTYSARFSQRDPDLWWSCWTRKTRRVSVSLWFCPLLPAKVPFQSQAGYKPRATGRGGAGKFMSGLISVPLLSDWTEWKPRSKMRCVRFDLPGIICSPAPLQRYLRKPPLSNSSHSENEIKRIKGSRSIWSYGHGKLWKSNCPRTDLFCISVFGCAFWISKAESCTVPVFWLLIIFQNYDRGVTFALKSNFKVH